MAALRHRYTKLALAILVGVALDQLTKLWAERFLSGRGIVQVVDGFLDLRLSHNRGAFFSLGENLPDEARVGFFVVATLFALGLMFTLFRRTQESERRLRVGLTLLGAGAIGNMIDRLRHGEVTDFMHLHLREVFHWATFNVADIWIAAGLVLLIVDSFRTRNPPTVPA